MEFRWVAALTLWTVLSGPVLVDFVAVGKSIRQPREVLVGRSEFNRPATSGRDYAPPGAYNTPTKYPR
jgi:hypothetical protein